MNKVFRVIWNEITQTWVAVSEHTRARGKRCSGIRLMVALGLLSSHSLTLAAAAPDTLPDGQQVTAGQADFTKQANNLIIRQHSQKLITQWQEFSIGENASVQFIQPNSSSAALNRVIGQNPSEILGHLSANGHVLLINPNGVVFGSNSRIDVASLSASTLELSDADFLNDKLHFKGDDGGLIQADGTIQLGEGGRIAFIAPMVEQNGTIHAPDGEVIMASGTDVELDITGHGLVSFRINRGSLNSVIENGGGIHVGSGAVLLSAKGFSEAASAVVNNSGVIEARGISKAGGRIMLGAGPGGHVQQSGTLNVASDTAKGGLVTIEAETITLTSDADIDATGATGGGDVLVGGDWQGGENTQRRVLADTEALQQATKVIVEADASIDASATQNGDGGTVVVWSDIRQSDSITDVQGNISARGGSHGGDGGQIETSGRVLNVEGARVTTTAAHGKTGDWLLDPGNITIAASGSGGVTNGGAPSGDTTISTATLSAALNSNNVTLTTGDGGYDITLLNDFNYTGASSSLTLDAGREINLYGDISSTNALNLSFSDGVRLRDNITLNSSGGDVTFASTLNGFSNLTVNSGAGDIALYGNVGGSFPLDQLVLNSSGNILLSQSNNPITITSYGTQTYNGAVRLQGATTIRSLGQTAQTLLTNSSGNLGFGGTAARLQITLVGAAGGSGGADRTTSGGASGAAGQVSAVVRVEDETLTVSQGNSGQRGQNESENNGGSNTELGGAGGSSSLGYAGGRGGDAGNDGRSGAGGGGGGATVVRFSSGDLVAGGAGGGGGGGDNGSGGTGIVGSTRAGISGSAGGVNSNEDSGGGGGGGGGLQGGWGGSPGGDEQPGSGGSAGSSGATSGLAKLESISTGFSGAYRTATVTRLAVNSGVTFNGSVSGNQNLSVEVQNGGSIQMNATVDTGSASQTYSAPVSLTGNSTFKGTKIAAGTVNLAAHELIIDETDQTTGAVISGVVSGTGKLIKRGNGKLILQADNTYSGGTDIEAGTAQSQRSNTPVSGSPTSGTFGSGLITITDGGGLDLNGTILTNALNLSGSGFSNGGAVFNSAGSFANWASGPITLTGDTVVNAGNGGLILNSAISGAHKLTLNHQGQTVYLRQAANIGALVSDGPLGVEANVTSAGTDGQQYNGATTFSDNIELAATNGTIGGSGAITANRLNFALNNASVDLSNRNNNFAGAIAIAGKDAGLGQNVSLVNRAGLTFSGAEIAGNLSTTTGTAGSAGGISQTGALKVGGTSQFIADTLVDQDADLQHADNDFGGSVSFTPANAGSWRNISIVDGVGGLILGNLTATGTLNATSRGGALTQAAGTTIVVEGTTDLLAQSTDGLTDYDITLDGSNNDFKNTVNATGKDITLVDGTGGITLGDVDASGNLIITSNGGVIDQTTGTTIEVDGTTGLLAQSADGLTDYDITLDGTNNDFKDTVNATGKDISLVDGTGGITLGDINASGNLNVTSNGGAIDQATGTSIVVDDTTNLLAQSTDGLTDYDITLDGANNDFKNTVNATGKDITLVDGTGGLTLGNLDASGNLDATSNGGTIDQAAGTTIEVDGTTDLLAQSVDGNTDFDITLDGANNNFKDTVNATGKGITLIDGTGGLTLGNVDASGNLDVTSNGGAINQAAGTAIEVDGTTDLLAQSADGNTDYDISLDGTGNDFKDTVTATGDNLTVQDKNDLKLTANASGNLNAQASGDIDASLNVAGNSNLSNSGNGDITVAGNTGTLVVDSGGDVIFRPTVVAGNSTIQAAGDVRETEEFALDVKGNLNLNVGGYINVGQEGGGGPDPAPEAVESSTQQGVDSNTIRSSDIALYEGSPEILLLKTADSVEMLDVRSIDLILDNSGNLVTVQHRHGIPLVSRGLGLNLNLKTDQKQSVPILIQANDRGELLISQRRARSESLNSNDINGLSIPQTFDFTTLSGRNIQYTASIESGNLLIKAASGLANEVLQNNKDIVISLILAEIIRTDQPRLNSGIIAATRI
ncbi:MAG: filamentous hemagglutinin N-terminal domain-containing protein [Amphritea sp.]|nr:filamentous hemagglutinin N-terminal domain-containing protein [Amphritea sp.]